MLREKLKSRYFIISIIVVVTSLIFIYRLFQLQIVDGAVYKEQSKQRLVKSVAIQAPRGEILDRYGRPLVTNRMGFSVQIQKINNTSNEGINDIILKLLNILEKNQEPYNDRLPISKVPPFEFFFTDDSQISVEQKSKDWKQKRNLDSNISATEVIDELKEIYEISDEYSDVDIRKIIGIREDMRTRQFSSSNPFVIANDVSEKTVMELEERHLDFPGVNITINPIRRYENETLAAHILGRVGIIYAEEFSKLEEQGYGMNDILGKDGIEKEYEQYLKGKKGVRDVAQNMEGKLTQVLGSRPPVPGNNVLLTIDAELQQVAEKSLEENIIRIRTEAEREIAWNPNKKYIGEDAYSGAVVVTDINSGEILAMASYPTYNPARFNKDYMELYNDPLKPMFNRAISGTYSPASTFKILTALAALEEDVIEPDEKILDKGLYMFYAEGGYTPRCWIYQAKYGYRTHGYEDVSDALRDSCNYFFYDVGRRLTIYKIDEYARMLGLGELTGVELQGENKGVVAGPEYKKTFSTEPWWPGETLMAAIGEKHAFTPIQLASYVGTIANRGTRYKTHLVKKVRTHDDGEIVADIQPEILGEVELGSDNLNAVLEGMQSVTGQEGTASRAFKDFPIKVAGKTGTAQRFEASDNGVFVGFAPYDNPQIAIAVVIEHGKGGSNTAPVARDIMATYFGLDREQEEDYSINSLVP